MLPTTGRFKDITCPFLESSCDRPYCHFSHKRKNAESQQSSTVPTYNPTPKSQLMQTKSHIPISYVPDIVSRSDSSKSRFKTVLEQSQHFQPVYKPTPLSILSSTQKSELTPSKINCKGDKKRVDNNEEYDPESCTINFDDLSNEFNLIDDILTPSDCGKDKLKEKEEISNSNVKNENCDEVNVRNLNISIKDDGDKSKKETKSNRSDKHGRKSRDENKKNSSKTNDKKDKKSSSSSRSKESDRKTKEKEQQKSSKSKKDERHRKDKKKDKQKEKETKKEESSKTSDNANKIETKAQTISINNLYDNSDINDDSDNNLNDLLGNDDLLDFEDEDDDVMKECYKIFNEYKPTEPKIELKAITLQKSPEENGEYVPTTLKKRVAHDKAEKIATKLPNKTKLPSNPALIMANRIKMARLAQADNEQKNLFEEIKKQEENRNHFISLDVKLKNQGVKRPPDKIQQSNGSNVKQQKISMDSKSTSKINQNSFKTVTPSTSFSCLVDDILAGKGPSNKPRKIAPAMNVGSIQRAKAKIEEINKQKAASSFKTPIQTIGKSGKRVAHVPEYSLSDIPDVLQAEKSKLPVNVRTRYLTLIADECVKLYLTRNDAYQRALQEEFKCYERCSVLATYRNSAMLAVNRLRKEVQDMEKTGLGPFLTKDDSINSGGVNVELKGQKLHKNMEKFILTENELVLHGYPRESSIPGIAVIKSNKLTRKVQLELTERQCCRCSKVYRVDRDGLSLFDENCIYHPLKKRTLRGESLYLCCKSAGETGCATAPSHVCDSPVPGQFDLEGYQTTFPPDGDDDPRNNAVYALDCEMCYTTKGLELTRVTIVNPECQIVYESLVKPLNPIVDYNTRFSGITKEQMDRTATTILQVQANILHLCNSKTILIGHSLESDMRALKIIHNSIVDTAVMFPHKFGLPHKCALRTLASDYLKKIIQNDVSGHDSAEDALTCMELVLWKIRDEMKSRGIKL